MTSHELRHAPATARNREPILWVLRRVLPSSPTLVLEIASGTGEHAAFLAQQLPHLTWQPSDVDPESLVSIEAWRAEAAAPNLRAPLVLDATAAQWPLDTAGAVVCINMIHISPWSATVGLIEGSGRLLPPDGPLYLYGPYRIEGRATAPSNDAFDSNLRQRNPAWGLRTLSDVTALATLAGFRGPEVVEMPANNFSVIFHKRANAGAP